MWEGIASSIISSIGMSLFTNYMDQQHRDKFRQRLAQIVNDSFSQYADTSLDRDKFALFIGSAPFVEMLRNYFFLLNSGEEKDIYLSAFIDEIHRQCPTADFYDIRSFINSIENVYTSFLKEEIEHIPEMNALYLLMLMSQKQLLMRIQASQITVARYFEVMQDRNVQISDEDILCYHRVCAKEFGVVRFTGISGVEGKGSQDLEQFYVENLFSYYSPFDAVHIYDNGKKPTELKFGLKHFFDGGNKVVLIGGAGLGKTTSLNYLFCKYEELYHAFALKLKIDLKDYASDISDKHHKILWCLTTEFSKRIPGNKLAFEKASALLARYLAQGKCLVVFDGLDEIPIQTSRNKVRDEISTFCEVYYLNRFIISTREVGYLRNCFDRDFIHIRIEEFEMKQIKQYSENWLKVNHQGQKFEEFWRRFDLELERAKCQALIRNPIILILALVIFDVQNSLPNRRVEFYKKCIDTFLIAREERKNAFEQTIDFKNILGDNSVVPKIAHYKFDKINEDMGYHFTMEELKEAIMQAIDVSNRRPWYEPVSLFAKYLINRTELIRERDEDVLDFAHKTFYEYFLAVYYAKEYETKELLELLDSWIGDPNKNEMARLIIEVIVEKNDARQHRAIIEHLFTMLDYDIQSGVNALSIIAELYKHNVLQAKYHDQYYNSLLFHAELAMVLTSAPMIELYYNERRMAELFLENIKRDPLALYSMIDALYCLNSKFTDSLAALDSKGQYQKITRLFSIMSLPPHRTPSQIREQQALYDYFITEPSGIFLRSPKVYLPLIHTALERGPKDLNSFLDFRFKENGESMNFLPYIDLAQLFKHCFDSPENLLLLLIAIIHCAYGFTNTLIKIKLRAIVVSSHIKDDLSCIQHQIALVQKLLFEEPELEIWITRLRAKSLYLEQYGKLYETLCSEYVSSCSEEMRQGLQ